MRDTTCTENVQCKYVYCTITPLVYINHPCPFNVSPTHITLHYLLCLLFQDLRSLTSLLKVPRSWNPCWSAGWQRLRSGIRKVSRTWWSLWAENPPRSASGEPASRRRPSMSSTLTLRKTPCPLAKRLQRWLRSWITTERWFGSGFVTADRLWKTLARSTCFRPSRATVRLRVQQKNFLDVDVLVLVAKGLKWLTCCCDEVSGTQIVYGPRIVPNTLFLLVFCFHYAACRVTFWRATTIFNAKMASELFKIWKKQRNPVVAVFIDEKKHFINIYKRKLILPHVVFFLLHN